MAAEGIACTARKHRARDDQLGLQDRLLLGDPVVAAFSNFRLNSVYAARSARSPSP